MRLCRSPAVVLERLRLLRWQTSERTGIFEAQVEIRSRHIFICTEPHA